MCIEQENTKTLKRKFADGRIVKDIIESKYKNKALNEGEFMGNISWLKIEKVKENWYVDKEKRCILAPKYIWLEIYPNNENYCITAIFNENKQIVEFYIDIAKTISVENGVPYEDDLYLDVVIVADGRKHLLDEDELKEALEKSIINKQEYDMAYQVAKKLMQINEEDIERLKKFSYKYLEILEKE